MISEFSDAEAAALYDQQNPWGTGAFPADLFYEALVMEADSVLDVGCGTGSMLHQARVNGHVGRLAGIDPDAAMLDRARRRADVEWVLGTAADIVWKDEFELATMASHAFQHLAADDDIRASLTAIRGALRDGGRFVFETRHPQMRAWESWAGSVDDVVTETGRTVRITYDIESVVEDVVVFSEVTSDPNSADTPHDTGTGADTGTPHGADGSGHGPVLRRDRTTFRFLDVPTLNAFLTEAGFEVEEQFGAWDRSPVTESSREIITVARRV